MEEILLQKDMTDSQKMMFQSEMNKVRKDKVVAILLCVFLGGLGVHKFYMGKIGVGIVYLLFFWTLIPSLIAFIEIFLLSGQVDTYNRQKAYEVATHVKAIS